jgi:Concanavalin A-like lectin/glucanases superfamily
MRKTSLTAVVAGLVAAGLVVVGASTADPARAAAAPTTVGLVLNYGFDNDSGVVASDLSSNAIHGTYINTTAAAARSTGVPGRSWAIKLVGAQHQYVSVPERNALDVNRFTVAALVNYTGVENDKTFGRWEVVEKAGAYWINIRTNGRVRVGGFFGGCTNPSWKYLDSNVVVPTNTWTHVASTYNGSTLTVWVNGSRAGSRAITGTTCSNNRPLAVGAKDYPEAGLLEAFWDGQLDDIRIYRRALSATEIRGLLPG